MSRPTVKSVLALALLLAATSLCSLEVDAFAGIAGGAGGGKLACESEGSVCYTQTACCHGFSCVRVNLASYGRCTPNRAEMRLADDFLGGLAECAADADCPSGQCCRPVATAEAAEEATGSRRLACGVGCGGGGDSSMESLFNQYYSAMMRKRSN